MVFPESFVPGFPVWNLVLVPIDQHELFEGIAKTALTVPGPNLDRLRAIERRHGILLSVGVTERSSVSVGCLWNANLLFDAAGVLVNHRRKLVPTWAEKLTWASGDAHGLVPVDSEIGRVGTLICGENTNILARYALLGQGEQVHNTTYPPAWPSSRSRERGYDLTRAIEVRSAAHSFGGRCSPCRRACWTRRRSG